jgi:hypothetical protein
MHWATAKDDRGSGLVLTWSITRSALCCRGRRALEADYKRELGDRFGIVFNRLLTLANMPIQRFGSTLVSKGQFAAYMTLLRDNHRPANLDNA